MGAGGDDAMLSFGWLDEDVRLQFDGKNAFNAVDRAAVLEAVLKYAPELLPL